MIPVICIIILPLNSRPEKKSGPEILKLERVVYLAMENDVDRDNCSLINKKLQQPTGYLTITCAWERGCKGLRFLEIFV